MKSRVKVCRSRQKKIALIAGWNKVEPQWVRGGMVWIWMASGLLVRGTLPEAQAVLTPPSPGPHTAPHLRPAECNMWIGIYARSAEPYHAGLKTTYSPLQNMLFLNWQNTSYRLGNCKTRIALTGSALRLFDSPNVSPNYFLTVYEGNSVELLPFPFERWCVAEEHTRWWLVRFSCLKLFTRQPCLLLESHKKGLGLWTAAENYSLFSRLGYYPRAMLWVN